MGLAKKSLAPDGTSGWWKEGDKVKSGSEAWQVTGGQWKKAKKKHAPVNSANA